MKRPIHVLAFALVLALTSSAHAAPRRAPRTPPPALTLNATPDATRAFHVRIALDVARADVAEAVADLRVLSFEVLAPGARRPRICSFPGAPTRNDPSKLVASPAAGSALLDAVVDLRMYCVGAAFDALEHGASITPVYGSRSASATRFVARDSDRRARRTANIRGEAFAFVARERTPSSSGLETRFPSMSTGRSPRALTARPMIVATREARVYLRSDLWHFDIRAPNGEVKRCSVPRHPVVPIRDFFTTLRAGRSTSSTIDLVPLCPGFFDAPGIYEVAAIAELVYDGGNVGLTAATGIIRGPVSFIRVNPPREADPSEFVRPE